MIRTPTDLIAYLRAVASAHPDIAFIQHGEDSRDEMSKLSNAEYPSIQIEVPQLIVPPGGDESLLSTRVFVCCKAASDNHVLQDHAMDRALHIALDILQCIKVQTEDIDFGITLAESVTITQEFHVTSDDVIGWTLPLRFHVTQALCANDRIDPDDVVLPQFKWENSEEDPQAATISITRHSIGSSDTSAYYWKEDTAQPTATSFDPDDGIEIAVDAGGPPYRIIHVWHSMGITGKSPVWAYARIDTRQRSGWSVPFVNEYPNV